MKRVVLTDHVIFFGLNEAYLLGKYLNMRAETPRPRAVPIAPALRVYAWCSLISSVVKSFIFYLFYSFVCVNQKERKKEKKKKTKGDL